MRFARLPPTKSSFVLSDSHSFNTTPSTSPTYRWDAGPSMTKYVYYRQQDMPLTTPPFLGWISASRRHEAHRLRLGFWPLLLSRPQWCGVARHRGCRVQQNDERCVHSRLLLFVGWPLSVYWIPQYRRARHPVPTKTMWKHESFNRKREATGRIGSSQRKRKGGRKERGRVYSVWRKCMKNKKRRM